MSREETTFLSADGKTTIHVRIWRPAGAPKAIVQIVHGMVEFIDRYERLADYLTAAGYAVIGQDLLAHGASVESEDDWGYLEMGKGADWLIADTGTVHQISRKLIDPSLPWVLFGHSMGSFIVRDYLASGADPDGMAGCVICGTNQQGAMLTGVANALSHLIGVFHGKRYRSQFLNNLAFGSYNKAFEPTRTKFDWLCKDTAIVDRYCADPRDQFVFTVSGYAELMRLIGKATSSETFSKTPSDIPLLVVAGAQDPVGAMGKGPTKVAELYRQAGSTDVTLKLFEGDRHEIHNELDYLDVFAYLRSWMDRVVAGSDGGRSPEQAERDR